MSDFENYFSVNNAEIGNVGVISAHPDDHWMHGHAIEAIHQFNFLRRVLGLVEVEIHELALSHGTETTKDFRSDQDNDFSIKRGDRKHEGRSGSAKLGIASYEAVDGQDGNLWEDRYKLANEIIPWAIRKNIQTFLTLGDRGHSDHITSSTTTHLAAGSLLEDEKWHTDILEVQSDMEGTWVARRTPKGVNRIVKSMLTETSQVRVAKTNEQSEWQRVSRRHSVHPADFEEFQAYPIFDRPAYYIQRATGSHLLTAMSIIPPELVNNAFRHLDK
jgi:hypothetical protein